MFMLRDYSKYAGAASLVIMTVTTKFVVTGVLLLSSNDQLGTNIMTNMFVTMRPMTITTKFVLTAATAKLVVLLPCSS